MVKSFIRIGGILLSTGLLAACVFNPQHKLSAADQCRSLQHEMLFTGSFNPAKTTDTSVINNRTSLQQQFQNLHCYDVLEKARKSQPGK